LAFRELAKESNPIDHGPGGGGKLLGIDGLLDQAGDLLSLKELITLRRGEIGPRRRRLQPPVGVTLAVSRGGGFKQGLGIVRSAYGHQR
jgi:hypothetical protein